MQDKKINVGLIGYGMAGQVFHAPLIDANPDLHLKTVVERHSDNSRKRYPWIEIVTDIEKVFNDDEIKLIVIATPNRTHFDLARQALLANKHVVVDKPFTVTSLEAKELTHLAKQQGKLLSVFQNRRWDGDFLTVKKIIEQGLLGRLVEFESHYDRYVNFIRDNPWKETNQQGNGLLYDLGSHLIDQALVLFGVPDSVFADMGVRRDSGTIIDHFEVILYYKTVKAILRSGLLVREAGARFSLHGTLGSFVKFGLDPQEELLKQGAIPLGSDWGNESPSLWGKLNTQINGEHGISTRETERGDYPAYYRNIINAISKSEKLIVTPEAGTDILRVIELAIQSNAEKRVIPFREN